MPGHGDEFDVPREAAEYIQARRDCSIVDVPQHMLLGLRRTLALAIANISILEALRDIDDGIGIRQAELVKPEPGGDWSTRVYVILVLVDFTKAVPAGLHTLEKFNELVAKRKTNPHRSRNAVAVATAGHFIRRDILSGLVAESKGRATTALNALVKALPTPSEQRDP